MTLDEAQRAFGRRFQWHQACIGLAGLADHDFLTRMRLVEQSRELRFGLVDVDDFAHEVKLVH
ncbi:MAG TPA: hypothetical protein VFN29_13410 [Chiayiivirga sp.]|nr:hypothetical protein [Chiayiivirga sp.]